MFEIVNSQLPQPTKLGLVSRHYLIRISLLLAQKQSYLFRREYKNAQDEY